MSAPFYGGLDAGVSERNVQRIRLHEIADLAAKRRLRRVQPAFCRDGEAAHRREIPKMA
jgi:hypothetical protein